MHRPVYVPAMPVLPGDMNGLAYVNAKTASTIFPYFLIVKRRKKGGGDKSDFVSQAADLIVSSWHRNRPAMVELVDEPEGEAKDLFPPSEHVLVLLHRYLRQCGTKAIPTISLDRTGEYKEAFFRSVSESNNGMAIRLYSDDLELPDEAIGKLVRISTESHCGPSKTDIVINLERILREHAGLRLNQTMEFLGTLARIEKFRSVTIVGSSIPNGITDFVPENGWRDVERRELALWRTVYAHSPLPLNLGDYGIVRPDYDDRIGGFTHINAKLFYSLNDSIRIFRGRSRQKTSLEDQYPELVRSLTSQPEFAGPSFSWGDAQIASYSRLGVAPGAPQRWVTIGTCHHIELAAAQVQRETEILERSRLDS